MCTCSLPRVAVDELRAAVEEAKAANLYVLAHVALRSAALSALDVLQSATIGAARLMRQEGRIGQLVPGAWADLLVVDGDPLHDVAVLAAPARSIRLLMQGGRIVRDTLSTAALQAWLQP